MNIVGSFIISLILTLILEVYITYLTQDLQKKDYKKIIIINCITNPIVVGATNFIYILLMNVMIRNIVLVSLEIFVVFIESKWYKKYLKNLSVNPLIYSLYINLFSFCIGWIVRFII